MGGNVEVNGAIPTRIWYRNAFDDWGTELMYSENSVVGSWHIFGCVCNGKVNKCISGRQIPFWRKLHTSAPPPASLRWPRCHVFYTIHSTLSSHAALTLCAPEEEHTLPEKRRKQFGSKNRQKKSTVSFSNHELAQPWSSEKHGFNARKRSKSDLLRLHRIAKRDHSSILNNTAQLRAARGRSFLFCLKLYIRSSYFKLGCSLRLYFVFHIRISYDNSFQPPEKILIFVLLGMPKYLEFHY